MAHSGKSSAAPPSHQYPLLLEQVSFQLCHPKKHYLALRQLSDVYTGLERKPKAHPQKLTTPPRAAALSSFTAEGVTPPLHQTCLARTPGNDLQILKIVLICLTFYSPHLAPGIFTSDHYMARTHSHHVPAKPTASTEIWHISLPTRGELRNLVQPKGLEDKDAGRSGVPAVPMTAGPWASHYFPLTTDFPFCEMGMRFSPWGLRRRL